MTEITVIGENHAYQDKIQFESLSKSHENNEVIFLYETFDPMIKTNYLNIEDLLYRGMYHLIIRIQDYSYFGIETFFQIKFSILQSLNCFLNSDTYKLLPNDIKTIVDTLCGKHGVKKDITDEEIQKLGYQQFQSFNEAFAIFEQNTYDCKLLLTHMILYVDEKNKRKIWTKFMFR
jgi:hypothetical protein